MIVRKLRGVPALIGCFMIAPQAASGQTAGAVPAPSAVYAIVNRAAFQSTPMTNGSYTTMATVSLTTGISKGPTGAWDVEVTMSDEPKLYSSSLYYNCIEGSDAGSNGAGSFDQGDGLPCFGSPTGALAGNTYVPSDSGPLPLTTSYSATYANSTK